MPMHDWTRVDDGIFHDFHTAWIGELRKVLNRGGLPKGFYALAEQQAGDVGPDVLTLHRPHSNDSNEGVEDTGGIAVAAEPPMVELMATSELTTYLAKRRTIVIRHRSGDRIVAMIEIVSPGNKRTRQQLNKFVTKAVKVISTGVHLLVIDSFPPGKRDPQGIHGAIWAELAGERFAQPESKPLMMVSYSAGATTTAYIQPFSVGQALKQMPLFLTTDRYVLVALEVAYQAAWDGTPDEVREILTGSAA